MTWTFISRRAECGAAKHAMSLLKRALTDKKIAYSVKTHHIGPLREGLVFIDLLSEPIIFSQFSQKTPPALAPQSFIFGKKAQARYVTAPDELGLAYAVYELAEQIADIGETVLQNWKELSASPERTVRGADRFITNSQDESWWMNRSYWQFYFEMLASSRFNSFTLLFGFDTAYLSPPYPFFVETPDYESVKVADWFKFDRKAYIAALNQIGELCHSYGLQFTVAIWQQIPWQSVQKIIVEGLDEDNIEGYCATGLKALLSACPHIDKIQFRVNHESGVGTQDSAEEYWLTQISALAEFNSKNNRDIALELRAKGMTDRMLNHGKLCGLNMSVSTKYWCEQTGLPYHITRMRSQEMADMANLNMSRRYSYADMLRRPRLNGFVYRLWCNGSTNLMTWADPDFVRRFMDSLRVGNSNGYEVMAPLSYKGGHEFVMGDAPYPLFADKQYQPKTFEEERYLLFYRMFGRIGYSSGESCEAWLRPMRVKYGESADSLVALTSAMSLIIPYVVAFHFASHPQQEYWAELNTGGALFAENTFNWRHKRSGITYQSVLPCDEGLFYGIDEYTAASQNGTTDGRITPYQSAQRLNDAAAKIAAALEAAENAGVPNDPVAKGIVLDAKMLRALGSYHVQKIYAALGLSKYNSDGDTKCLESALAHMRNARILWAELSELGAAYHLPLNFSIGAAHVNKGEWAESLPEVDADIAQLEGMMSTADNPSTLQRNADIAPTLWKADIPEKHAATTALRVTLDIGSDKRISSDIRLRWRTNNHLDGLFRSVTMTATASGSLEAVIPAEKISADWDLLLYFEATDKCGDSLQHPGIYHPQINLPYFIVSITE